MDALTIFGLFGGVEAIWALVAVKRWWGVRGGFKGGWALSRPAKGAEAPLIP